MRLDLPPLGALTEPHPSDRDVLARSEAVLRAALDSPLPSALGRWAADLDSRDGYGDGDVALLGTSLRGPRYEALLWNGARCPEAAPLVAGLVAASCVAGTDLAAPVAAGVRVAAALRAAAPPGPAVASVDTVACAVTLALLADVPLGTVVDAAAGLMVLAPASSVLAGTRVDLARRGHPVASGWLAVRMVIAGFTPMVGALAATLAAVGSPAADLVS